MKCTNCGAQNDENSAFCDDCGESISENNFEMPPVLFLEPVAGTIKPIEDPFQNTRLGYYENDPCVIISSASSVAHIGFVKDEQEDRAVVKAKDYGIHDISVYIAVVCDGMGGYSGGEICAQIGVGEFTTAVYEVLPASEDQSIPRTDFIVSLESRLEQTVQAAIAKANRRVRNYLALTGQDGGGAIIVASVILVDHKHGRIKIFGYSQGDARALLFTSDGNHKLLTTDHAINGKPTRFLGVKDSIGTGAFSEEFWFSHLDFNSISLLLYSDGLWQMLTEEEITTITSHAATASQVANGLLNAALQVEIPAGACGINADPLVTVGDDNIGIVAINFTKDKKDTA